MGDYIGSKVVPLHQLSFRLPRDGIHAPSHPLTFDTMIYFIEKSSCATTVPNCFENALSFLPVKMWRNALVRAREQGFNPHPLDDYQTVSLFLWVVIRVSLVVSCE